MSKIFFLYVMILTSLDAMEWLSYEEGLELQEKNGKVIMLDIIRSDCRFCKEMEADVFENEEMVQWLSKKFIAVKINLDIDEIPLGITIHFTPSFFFINTEQRVVKKVPGAWSIQDFKDLTKGIK